MPLDLAVRTGVLVAVVCGMAGVAGCLDDKAAHGGATEESPPTALLPGVQVGGCDHHNLFLQVPTDSARALVPAEFDLFQTGPFAQAQISFFSCPDVALAAGGSLGPARWLMAQVRLADVEQGLAGKGITWYLVAGYTDSRGIAALYETRGLPLEEATFDLVPLAARWSFTLQVTGADGPVLALGQASEPAVVADQVQDHRTLSGSGGWYVWEDQAFTMARGYIATTTAHATSGPIADLFAGGPNGLYSIPGEVREGLLSFGSQGPPANVEVGNP